MLKCNKHTIIYFIALYVYGAEMKVPKEIRDVERPANTVVYAFGHDPVKYNVKERTYDIVNGKRIQKDGATVGAIIDLKFVPVCESIHYSDSDMLFWGKSQLIVNQTTDILQDLLKIYNRNDALKTYVMAVLRASEGDLKDYEMKRAYGQDFVSVLYPGVPLSKDTVGKHLYDLGRTCSRITEFMTLRSSRVPANHLVAVDGMLKSYESANSIYSGFSRKALKTGTRDISVMYAYDVDAMEPVCSKIYPGNMTDVSVFRDFLESNSVTKGLIITDKGFSLNSARQTFLDNPDLHFLIPLRRDAKIIEEYHILNTNSRLNNRFGIECRKERMHEGRYLYAYRDTEVAKNEEQAWIEKHENYNPAELESLRREFGTIVFVSDLDAPPGSIYAAYEERWELEVVFRFYKHILNLDETRVESEQSDVGTEFVNFLSTIMICRLRKSFYSVRELQKYSFRGCMKLLRKGIMIRKAEDDPWLPMKLTTGEEAIFTELGLFKGPEKVVKKRGRPAGSKNRKS